MKSFNFTFYPATLALLLAILCFSLPSVHAQGTFTYLDDGAEIGGYDVTADIQKQPAEFMLAQQDNNDGYVLRVAADSVELARYESGKKRMLAQSRASISPGPIVVQRRGARWNVITGSRIVLQAEDTSWQDGKIGHRGGLANVRVQPVEEISFDDDFMRIAEEVAMEKARENPKLGVKISDVKTEETLWTPLSGAWSTTGINENAAAQVAQSANPFAFKSNMAGANLAVAGRAFWSDYEVGVSVKPQGAKAIGLAVYVQDAKNYLLFHWPENGPLQLRAVTSTPDGKSQVRVLDEATLEPASGYEQKQWYRLRVAIASGVLRAYIDDIELLRARTGYFGRGQVAVYSENPDANSFATFDDVSVRSVNDIYEDFSTRIAGRWQTQAGAWNLTNVASPSGTQGAFTVTGETDWQNYTTSADINLPADSSAGLVLHHQAGQGTYALRITGSKAKLPFAGTVQIFRIQSGKTQVLAEQKTGTRYDNSSARWSFSGDNGYLRASVEDNGDTKMMLDAFDETIPDGRAGLYGQRGAQGTPRISAFSVEFPRVRATWAKVPDLYELERQAETMGGWSTPEGFWAPANPLDAIKTSPTGPASTPANPGPPTATTVTSALPTGPVPGSAPMPGSAAGPSNRILWHKGAFWGDDSIRFKLPKLSTGQTLSLVLGDARRAGSQALILQTEGDTLKAGLASADLSGTELKLGTAGASQRGEIKIVGDAQLIEVQRRGSFLIVRAGAGEEMKTLIAARVYR